MAEYRPSPAARRDLEQMFDHTVGRRAPTTFFAIPCSEIGVASMNISLPDPTRDYVQDRIDSGHYASISDYIRDLIRRDQGGIADEEHWLRDLDVSITKTFAEMNAGGGLGLDAAFDTVLAGLAATDVPLRR